MSVSDDFCGPPFEISPAFSRILRQVPPDVAVRAAELRDNEGWTYTAIGWELCGKEVLHAFMPAFVEFGRLWQRQRAEHEAQERREQIDQRLAQLHDLDRHARVQWALEQWERCEDYAPIGRALGISRARAERLIGKAVQLNAGNPRHVHRNGLLVKRGYRDE